MVEARNTMLVNQQDVKDELDYSTFTSFQNEKDGFSSKVHINRFFYNDYKNNIRRHHFKRRKSLGPSHAFESYIEECPEKKAPFTMNNATNDIYQTAIPNCVTYGYEATGGKIFNSKFTPDGKKLVVAKHTGASLFNFGDDGKLEFDKAVSCPKINIAVTDLDISEDSRYAIHSNLGPFVHMLDLQTGNYVQEFSLKNGSVDVDMADELFWFFSLRIFSLKLSHDAKEIIAGCGKALNGAPVQIYDVEAQKLKTSVFAHKEDINGISYLDKRNSSVFITASDDGVCKLWDTRILKNFTPVGIFYGHVSGLTSIESKEDNRYFLSNCKDQSIKLWDVRNTTTEKKDYPFLKYDYRYETLTPQHVDQIKQYQKRFDQSVMSFWGHQVHLTLIRSHFSPLHGTNQRYIYTGSFDGKVHIFDTVTGEHIAKLESDSKTHVDQKSHVVRDCAWHPYSQNLVSTNFRGDIYKWEYTDLRDAEKLLPDIERIHDAADDDDMDIETTRKKVKL